MISKSSKDKSISRGKELSGAPSKVFGFDVVARVPPSFTLRFNQLVWDDGTTQFDTSAVLYVKTSNKASFYSYKNIYMETPSEMNLLYPNLEWRPDRS